MSTDKFIENLVTNLLHEKDSLSLISTLTLKDFIKIKEYIKQECKEYINTYKKVDNLDLSPSLMVPYLEKTVIKRLLQELKTLLKDNFKEKSELYESKFLYWGFLMQNLVWFEQIERLEETNISI